MKKMVFDVPAESGGALTILNQYYDAAIKDTSNEWFFVVSIPQLKEHQNVKVINYPWVKKSWFHRLYFDRFVAPKLVQEHGVEEVLSLQNIIVPHVKVKQILYLHQSLPFVEKKYSIRENFKFWIYQNIIGRIIFQSIRKADKVIVQTKWIMNAAIKETNVGKEKFILKQPKLNITVKKLYASQKENKVFFYPASEYVYKNHEIIIKACIDLKNKGINNYQVVLTLNGNENEYSKQLQEVSIRNNLPIHFIGPIDIETVYEYYSKSILVFPSYIETLGLPMLEAKKHQTPIIASDCPFSREILDDYEKVVFFNPFDTQELVKYLEEILSNKKFV